MYHRYHVVHICSCGKLYSHSQAECDEHRLHPIGIDLPSYYLEHGDTAKTLFDRISKWGLMPYGTEGYHNVYDYMANNE
jgi:hypothetical protein